MILRKRREKNIVQKEIKNVAQRKKTKTVKDKNLEIKKPDYRIDIFCTAIPKQESLKGILFI